MSVKNKDKGATVSAPSRTITADEVRIENGNPLIRIDTDQKSKGFLVFLFEKNDLLNRNLEKWRIDKEEYLIS